MTNSHRMGRRNATLSVLLSCALVAGAAGVASAQAAPTPSPSGMRASSVFGTTGSGPNSVAVDSAGNVYTTNTTANNVTRINSAGETTVVGTTGAGPIGIALDAAGNVYTSNIGANNVTRITPAGVTTVVGTTGQKPMGIKLDAAGNVYTTNYIDSTVTKITPEGVSTTLAATGRHPLGITLDSAGNVFTANEATNTVTKITPDGTASTLGRTGGWPQAIAMDSSGNLYTANWNTANVSKITPRGVSKILGGTGRRPIGIAVDGAGNVYTTNNGDDSVSRVTQAGASRTIAVTGRRPVGLAIDSVGNLYSANFLANTVNRISKSPARQSSTVTLSTVTVGAPNNPSVWIIPFYNSVYQSQSTCITALNAILANPPATYDPAVQKETLIPNNCVEVGRVSYGFNIGETEITTAQWVTFLNTADPKGLNRHHLWDSPESSLVWPKFGSINRNLRAPEGQRYYVASPGWANRPYNSADFSRSARFINSLNNGTLVSKKTAVRLTVSGTPLKVTTYTVRMSPETETGMYTMSNLKATRNSKKGFALTSQDEWIKAAYYDPKGGGTFSYWDYPTNPGKYVNCPVDTSGCAEGDQPNATQMDANGNVTNSAQQPLASFEPVPGTAPDWCPVASLTPTQCTAQTPFPPVLPYNGNVSPVGQALTRSPWGTLDQGGNVVEALDTISPPPAISSPKIVWRRWHGGVVTATAYQMWLSAIGSTPQTIPGYAINPWRGFRIAVRGK